MTDTPRCGIVESQVDEVSKPAPNATPVYISTSHTHIPRSRLTGWKHHGMEYEPYRDSKHRLPGENAVCARKQTEIRARGVRICVSQSDATACGRGEG